MQAYAAFAYSRSSARADHRRGLPGGADLHQAGSIAVWLMIADLRRRLPTQHATHLNRDRQGAECGQSAQIAQSLMLDCLPRTSNSPTWTRSLGGRRRAWRVESAMRTDCLVVFVIPSMRDAVFTVSP
jgi:hypothetical protein